jgi:hypothetical protein
VRSEGGERVQASLTCLRIRARGQQATRSRLGERELEVGRWQQVGYAFGPFDQAHRIVAKAIGEARSFPFFRVREPIKIKVIKV